MAPINDPPAALNAAAELHPAKGEDANVVTSKTDAGDVIVKRISSQDDSLDSRTQKTRAQKRLTMIQLATVAHMLFNLGWNDGTPGPLLPRLQDVYGYGYTLISMVFVLTCVGFITGAVVNIWLSSRFTMGKIWIAGSLLQLVAYSVQCAAPPFPAFVVMNFLNGLGLALQDAHANAFVASQSDNAETKMGIVQAFYGFGAFVSALVSTQFSNLHRWSFHYLVSLGLAIIHCILVIIVFRGKSLEECLREAGEDSANRLQGGNGDGTKAFKDIMKNPSVHILGTFLFLYVGVEIAIGGWITTFVLEERGGDENAGYIATGFFGALAIGRILLLPINAWCGERIVVVYYTVITIGLEFVVWFVPSLIGNGIAVAFIGLFLAPMYPLAMNQAARVLPRKILTGSIGWIASFGQVGSAIVPFVTGAISQEHGIWTMNPVAVALTVVMVGSWTLLPRVRPEEVEEADLGRAVSEETLGDKSEKKVVEKA